MTLQDPLALAFLPPPLHRAAVNDKWQPDKKAVVFKGSACVFQQFLWPHFKEDNSQGLVVIIIESFLTKGTSEMKWDEQRNKYVHAFLIFALCCKAIRTHEKLIFHFSKV